MKLNFYALLMIFTIVLSGCTKQQPEQTTQTDLAAELGITIPNEAIYPQPVTKQAFYFINTLSTFEQTKNIKTEFGTIDIFYQLLQTLKNEAVKDYLNNQIEQKLDQIIANGIPKYPGIVPVLKDLTFEKFSITNHVFAANNILSVTFYIEAEFSEYKTINSSRVFHFDLLSGQEITLNNIMNSNTGLEDLNHMILSALDTFVDPADIEEFISLYNAPFLHAFQGFTEEPSISLYPISPLSVILNEQCTSCYFPWQYNS